MASSTKTKTNTSNTLINTEVNTKTTETAKVIKKTVKKAESIPAVVVAEVPKPVDIPIITETAVIASPSVLEPSPVVSASKVTLNTIHTWPFPLGSRP
jgi:hypothetical protein